MNQQTTDFIKKTSPDTLRQHLQDGFGYVTIIILSVVYLATSFVTLSPSGKTVQEILIDGFAYAALSLAMDRLFALQGCRNGERDARVVATIAAHGRAVESVAGWFDRLEDWCERESAAALAKIRAAIQTPIIAGGLIDTKEEIFAAMNAGASVVSTGKPELWEM